jgi:hypothetical protein
MRCRKCIGEINVKRRPHLAAARLSKRMSVKARVEPEAFMGVR